MSRSVITPTTLPAASMTGWSCKARCAVVTSCASQAFRDRMGRIAHSVSRTHECVRPEDANRGRCRRRIHGGCGNASVSIDLLCGSARRRKLNSTRPRASPPRSSAHGSGGESDKPHSVRIGCLRDFSQNGKKSPFLDWERMRRAVSRASVVGIAIAGRPGTSSFTATCVTGRQAIADWIHLIRSEYLEIPACI